jgi:hypothetical protein
MPYPASFLGDKFDPFEKIFCVFFMWCRLASLKALACKGSRSELFTNHFPSPGTETKNSTAVPNKNFLYKPLPLTGDGNIYRLPNNFAGQKHFTNHFPSPGTETLLSPKLIKNWTNKLYKPLPLTGDGCDCSWLMRVNNTKCSWLMSKPVPARRSIMGNRDVSELEG